MADHKLDDAGFKVEIVNQVPNEEVEQLVADYKLDPNYVSSKVSPDGDNTSSVEVTFRKPQSG